MKVKLLSRVRLFATPWTAAYQAPLSMGFSRQKCWSGVPLPSPSDSPSQAQIYHDTFTHLKIFYYQLLLLFSCKSCPTLCDPMNYSLPASSVIPFCFCLKSYPASKSFPVSQLFPLGGQSVRASASASVLPVNIQA